MFRNLSLFVRSQMEWIKSFLSECLPDGNMKGSSKRALTVTIIYLFARSVISTGEKTGWKEIPNIPEAWLWLLGIILGANLVEGLKSGKLAELLRQGNGDKK